MKGELLNNEDLNCSLDLNELKKQFVKAFNETVKEVLPDETGYERRFLLLAFGPIIDKIQKKIKYKCRPFNERWISKNEATVIFRIPGIDFSHSILAFEVKVTFIIKKPYEFSEEKYFIEKAEIIGKPLEVSEFKLERYNDGVIIFNKNNIKKIAKEILEGSNIECEIIDDNIIECPYGSKIEIKVFTKDKDKFNRFSEKIERICPNDKEIKCIQI
jgi:hypothetical protein